MDQSFLRPTPHLASARGGQSPLVAAAFKHSRPNKLNKIRADVK